LAEPEECLAPHPRLRVRAGDPNERGTPAFVRLLRQGEDRLLLHVPVEVGIVYQVGQVVSRGVGPGLTDRTPLLTSAPWRRIVAGDLQAARPNGDRSARVAGSIASSPPRVSSRVGEAEQEVDGRPCRRGAEVGDGGLSRRGDPNALPR